jgi:hypothetical protein
MTTDNIVAAIAPQNRRVAPIWVDDDDIVMRGKAILQSEGYVEFHRVIHKNSNIALPELFLTDEKFKFVFIDGWKMFDHLAFEIYLINLILKWGGWLLTIATCHLFVRLSNY